MLYSRQLKVQKKLERVFSNTRFFKDRWNNSISNETKDKLDKLAKAMEKDERLEDIDNTDTFAFVDDIFGDDIFGVSYKTFEVIDDTILYKFYCKHTDSSLYTLRALKSDKNVSLKARCMLISIYIPRVKAYKSELDAAYKGLMKYEQAKENYFYKEQRLKYMENYPNTKLP